MNQKLLFVFLVFAIQCISVQTAHALPCVTICDDQDAFANQFMPSYGTIMAYDEPNNTRYVYNGFAWETDYGHSWYKLSDYSTLEPRVIFPGTGPYTTDFDPPFDWGFGAYMPSSPRIVYSANMPCPYAVPTTGTFVPTISVGSACANNFQTGEKYYTISRVKRNSPSGYMWANYQRGRWGIFPIVPTAFFLGPVCHDFNNEPVWEIAPFCAYCCANTTENQDNEVEVIYESNPVAAPGCYDWVWTNGRSIPTQCKESKCSDGRDNDKDGLIDCNDPDCLDSPDCQIIIVDPCASVLSGNGYYCGNNEELTNYSGNDDDLIYCYEGTTASVEYCENGCQLNNPGENDECVVESCLPICSSGQTQCNGNNVEICSLDRCSFTFDYSCGSGQTCVNGSCIAVTAPAPVINSVSCNSYYRGITNVTCAIYGNNFNCGTGSNTFIGGYYNGPAQSCTLTQLVVSLNWSCLGPVGFVQVSHRNPDNQRADRFDVLEVLMGELIITDAWQDVVHEGATNVPMGANGCNFGPNVVFHVGGVQLGNVHLQAEDQVLATGTVVGSTADSPADVCVAKYPNATPGFDKKCFYNYVSIVP